MTHQPTTNTLERRLQRERNARKEAERLLTQKSAELYEALQDNAHTRRKLELAIWAGNESIWEWDAEKQTYELLSFPEQASMVERYEGTTGSMFRRVHVDDREVLRMNWHLLISDNISSLDIVIRMRLFQGSTDRLSDPYDSQWRWIHCRGKVVQRDETGQASRVIGTIKDITQQRNTEESFRMMAKAFASSREAMLVVAGNGRILEANRAFYDLLHLTPGSIQHHSIDEFLVLKMPDSDKDTSNQNQTTVLKRDGMGDVTVQALLSRFSPDRSGRSYTIITLRDMREQQQAQQALEHMAQHDALTNLPNRGRFHEQLQAALVSLPDDQVQVLMFLDIDGFKAVNDEFGHIAADAMLVNLARRLQSVLPEGAIAGRWGGDEFVLSYRRDDQVDIPDPLPATVLRAIREPATIAGVVLRLTASIGTAESSADLADANELIRRADSAMYEAKASGRNQVRTFSGSGGGQARRVSLVSALSSAIEQDELEFFVQPKFNRHRQIVGGEMLARWQSGSHGVVSPAVFIPLIEQHGLNAAFSEAVLHYGTRYTAAMTAIDPKLHLAINLSAWQLLDGQLLRRLTDQCLSAHVAPASLELEITESVFMQPQNNPAELMQQLRELGFRLAIDDFGTGYSSLGYLRTLPLSTVKIDRCFVVDADQNERARRILSAIIQMSHDLGMSVVAEGVETESQWQLLAELDVELFQGFLLGKPMPFRDFLHLLQPLDKRNQRPA
ncbi:putative bifunctional diguanylate cyclase/phosphodiesterase [Parathalassolituus penaei]|uniref:EAL domain-containing protein n=1 Tax=Parathalassolituus penaei TaxID=2997323 RepID=A0A9X3ISZ4_9GAMM|nr:GGDEF domain-containing phosphodiesterase [Parathalassolituus penaei]MCY0966351.1 EAL domain-containing protein [Parathalassolituus penaei]